MDPDSSWLGHAIIFVSLVLAAIASAAETTIIPITRLKVRNLASERHSKAEVVDHLVSRPHVFLSAILAVKSIGIITASVLATRLLEQLISTSWSPVLAILMMGFTTLVVVETLPKAFASRHSEGVASLLVTPVTFVAFLLNPLINIFGLLHKLITSRMGGKQVKAGPLITEGDFKTLVSVGEEDGILEEDEKEMVLHILELEDTPIREIMIPRIDIVGIGCDSSANDVLRLIVEHGYSRIPLFEETIDHIVGILYAKDLLKSMYNAEVSPDLLSISRAPYFIPESKKVDDLLREFQQQGIHIAIAVDEYGGTAGLVTIEDLLEEIVGDIKDEHDREESLFEQVNEDEWIVDGRMGIDDFNDLLGLNINIDNVDTLSGFISDRLGKVPVNGDEITVEGLEINVLSTAKRRIKKIRVRKGASSVEEPTNRIAAEVE